LSIEVKFEVKDAKIDTMYYVCDFDTETHDNSNYCAKAPLYCNI
jgi:hypothetical protein